LFCCFAFRKSEPAQRSCSLSTPFLSIGLKITNRLTHRNRESSQTLLPMRIFDIAPKSDRPPQYPVAPQCIPRNEGSILLVTNRVKTWRSISENNWDDPQVPCFCTDYRYGGEGNPYGAVGCELNPDWPRALIGSTSAPAQIQAMEPHSFRAYEETEPQRGQDDITTTNGQILHFSTANESKFEPEDLIPSCSRCPPTVGESFYEFQSRRYTIGTAHSIYLDFTPLRLQFSHSSPSIHQAGHQSHLSTIARTAVKCIIKLPMIIELETLSLIQQPATKPCSLPGPITTAPSLAIPSDILTPPQLSTIRPSDDFVAPPSWICWVSNSDVDSVLGWSHRIQATLWNQKGFNSQPTRGETNIRYSLQVFNNVQAIPIPLPSVNGSGLTATIVISPV
jgi:hypothetical protein